jgi:hypothetical protein
VTVGGDSEGGTGVAGRLGEGDGGAAAGIGAGGGTAAGGAKGAGAEGGVGAVGGRLGIGTNSPGFHVCGIRRIEGSFRNRSA